jgi:acid stress chaperone HdeB
MATAAVDTTPPRCEKLMFARPLTAAIVALSVVVPISALAQDDLELSSLTCSDFLSSDADTASKIMFWLGGYYTYEDDPPIIGLKRIEDRGQQIKQYCADHPSMTLLSASEIFMDKKYPLSSLKLLAPGFGRGLNQREEPIAPTPPPTTDTSVSNRRATLVPSDGRSVRSAPGLAQMSVGKGAPLLAPSQTIWLPLSIIATSALGVVTTLTRLAQVAIKFPIMVPESPRKFANRRGSSPT